MDERTDRIAISISHVAVLTRNKNDILFKFYLQAGQFLSSSVHTHPVSQHDDQTRPLVPPALHLHSAHIHTQGAAKK